MEAKLEHDSRSVRLDSSDSNSQESSDLLIRFALGQQADDFNLPWSCSDACPPAVLTPAFLEKSIQYDIRHLWSEKPFTLGNGLYGFPEGISEIGFQKVSVGPGVQCAAYQLIRLVHREHKDLGV